MNAENIEAAATWQERTARVASGIRTRVLAHVLKNDGGYMSQACSSAEILAALYTRIMRLGPSRAPLLPLPFTSVPGPRNPRPATGADYNGPRAPDLDRFILSPVHYALVLYATLIETGRLAPEALDSFNREGSTLEMIGAEHSPGHEVTAGSLGQAISQAGGIALARRLLGETGRVWVLLSDGELQEGQVWEAVEAMAFHRLDNLGIYIDANGQCCDGKIEQVMASEPLVERLRAFGADACEVDGHDPEALLAPAARLGRGKPLAVVARTDPCRGLPLLCERAPRLHYLRFRDDAERAGYREALQAMRAEQGEA